MRGQSLDHEVIITLGDHVADFDVPAIVEEHDTTGRQ